MDTEDLDFITVVEVRGYCLAASLSRRSKRPKIGGAIAVNGVRQGKTPP